MGAAIDISKQLWWKRAQLPAYAVGRAADLVEIHASTLSRWQNLAYVIPKRERGKGLSYLQLIEAAVVSRMRKVPIKLSDIRAARAFVSEKLGSHYPFATHKFMTDGVDLLLEFDDVFEGDGRGKRVVANRGGQLGWSEMFLETIKTFEYEDDVVVRWHVAGTENPVTIDPRVSFGSAQVCGIPTDTLFSRWHAGEKSSNLADDYELDPSVVRAAIEFEGKLRGEALSRDIH